MPDETEDNYSTRFISHKQLFALVRVKFSVGEHSPTSGTHHPPPTTISRPCVVFFLCFDDGSSDQSLVGDGEREESRLQRNIKALVRQG